MYEKVKRFFIEKIDLCKKEFYYLNKLMDYFSAINNHNITIGEYLRDCEHLEYLRQRCALVPEINTHLLERNTVLQV